MNRIRDLRIMRGWLQDDLAKQINLSRQTVSCYENETRSIDIETIHRLCDIFGCTADYLLGRSDMPTPQISAEDMSFGFIPFFLLCTGLRRSEALQRPTADIDLDRWEIRIPKAKTPDGVRTVPIIEPLKEPLKKWMAAHSGEWLFPHIDYYAGRKGKTGYMSDTNWDTAWTAYCKEHGWLDAENKPALGAHNLRHGTATLLYEAEVDVYTAQHILGHANVTTTLEIYTELRKKHETKNIKKFSRKLSKMLSKNSKLLK